MSMIDITPLLQDLSEDAPCGPDLEYSADYTELSRLIQGTPDIEYGDMHRQAEEPAWKVVKELALRLLARSRDLRLAVNLTCACVCLDGIAGLESGLSLIEGLLERHWDRVHPQLDPDDANDPTARINILVALEDKDGLIRYVSQAPLVDAPDYGRFCMRDIDKAEGELAAQADEVVPDIAVIEAVFKAVALDALEQTAATLRRACAQLERIETLLTERVGHARAIRFAALSQLLCRAQSTVTSRLRRHPQWVGEADAQFDAQDAQGEAVGSAPKAMREIAHRDDVVRLLDMICEYYAREDPGSPVPLFLQRARRLVNMSFIEIINDLSPQSISEINHLAGIVDG